MFGSRCYRCGRKGTKPYGDPTFPAGTGAASGDVWHLCAKCGKAARLLVPKTEILGEQAKERRDREPRRW